MAQIINTNMASLNAQRNLNKSQSANQTAMERLSSGLRINSAKDDAAGMAISTRFTSQIKGLNVAVRNAGDGIALAQTAEGALGSMNDNLQRIRELAVQSANATNSDVDREALQAEVDQLISEISRTAQETDFNGRKLLDGSFKATFQIGANAGQTVDINISELTADKLGSSLKAGLSAQGTDKKLSNGDLIINGEAIRASVSGDDALSYKNKESSAIAKVAAINASSDKTGVTAKVDENVVLGSKIEDGEAGKAVAGSIKLNGVEIALQGTDNTNDVVKAGTRNSVVAAINAKSGQTGVIAEDGGANGGVILKAADGRNITIEFGTKTNPDYDPLNPGTDSPTVAVTQDDLTNLGLGKVGTAYAGFTLTAANANTPINISGGNGTGNGDLANAGLKAGNYKAQTAATTSTKADVKSDVESIARDISAYLAPAAELKAGDADTIADIDTVAKLTAFAGDELLVQAGAYNTDLVVNGLTSVLAGNAPGGMNFVADTTTEANATAYLGSLATHLGLTPADYSVGTGTTGIAAAGEEALAQAMAEQVNKMFTDFNAKNTGGTELVMDNDALQETLEGLGIDAGTAFGGADVDIATDTLDDLYSALVGIKDLTPPSAWQGSTDTIDTLSVSDLAAALSKMQKENPAAKAQDRALQDGDLVINGVTIGASSALDDTASYTEAETSNGAASAIAIAAAINKSYDATGVKAAVNATEFVGSGSVSVTDASKGATMTLTVNGVDITLADQGDYEKNKAAAISSINERAGQTGVKAMDNGVSLTLTAADGRNISFYAESNSILGSTTTTAETKAENFGLKGLDTVNSAAGGAVDAKGGAMTVYGTVTLTSSKAFEVSYGTGGEKGLSDSGLVAGKFGGGEDGQALTEIDISTFEGAQKAIVAIDNAIGQVASQRADLGAIQNRMESTVSNLQVTSENLNSARSRIMDADFAAETAEMSRSQVLQQAGISILAQANASGQNVLSLLG